MNWHHAFNALGWVMLGAGGLSAFGCIGYESPSREHERIAGCLFLAGVVGAAIGIFLVAGTS